MRTVYLHGELQSKFGGPFRLDVATAHEAGRALAANFPEFANYVRHRHFRVIRGDLNDGMDLDHEQIARFDLGRADLHIVPVLAGAGDDSGIIKIAIGAVLIVASIFLPYVGVPATIAVFGAEVAVLGATGIVATIGLAVALGGISQLLAATPGGQKPQDQDKKVSYLFNGVQNVGEQGYPVPLVFGRCRVGSVVVSAGIEASDFVPTRPNNTLALGQFPELPWFNIGDITGGFGFDGGGGGA